MTCTKCGGTTADGIYLDEPCQQALWSLLSQIPDTLTDAEDTVARLDARRGTGRSTTAGAPINLEASQRVTELDGLLASWSRMVYEETGQVGDAGADYLRHAWQHIIGQGWAGDMLDELDRAHRRVVACVDVPPEVRAYGPCQIDGCAGLIRGRVGDVLARCRECHEPYDATALRNNMLENAWTERAPLASVIRALNAADVKIKYDRAKKWVERGKLTPGEDGQFTMAQVMAALNAA